MGSRGVGRPPTEGITEALMDAAEDVMTRQGYSALTVDGVAAAAGTTRPTFYRRFPGVAHLALAVIVRTFGTGNAVDFGSLAADLLALQREEIAMFSHPVLSGSLLGMLAAATADEELRHQYVTTFIAPRRANVARVIQHAVKRGELAAQPTPADVEMACDILLGPVLVRAMLPVGAPLDDALAHRTTNAAIRALARVMT